MFKIRIGLLLIAAFQALPEVTGSEVSETLKILRGVTMFRAPFVEKDSVTGKLRGFYVDLLDELSRVGKFNYTMRELEGLQDSSLYHYPTFLILDVLDKKADFAIADWLWNTENYMSTRFSQFANFTQPYITSGLSALVQKSFLTRDNITTFEELMDKTAQKSNQTEGPKSDIQTGFVPSSLTYLLAFEPEDSLSQQLHDRLNENPDSPVENQAIGVWRAANQPYAFIQEQIQNELEVNKNCDLTHLPMKRPELEYSIAVRKRP